MIVKHQFLLLLGLVVISCICKDSPTSFKNINAINLLLPQIHSQLYYNGVSPQIPRISYNLVASHKSCYEWGSTNQDSLFVVGKEKNLQNINEEKCLSEAVVWVNSLNAVDKVIWITAKEKKTGEVTKVEAKIAKVKEISIVTRLRSIDVGDNQVITIQGVDEHGNVFTSLEGIQFEWEIRQTDKILEQITFEEASIQTTELRIAMERSNIFSDTIVVRGVKTGSVRIYARIKEEGYPVIEDTITMKVIEHFFLFPEEEIFILPTTSVQFDLALVKTEKNAIELQQIDLPNNNYNWQLNDTSKGQIDNKGLFTGDTAPGDIELRVNDQRIEDNELKNLIHIVEPYLIKVQIKEYEGNEWDQSLVLPKIYTQQQAVSFTNNWNLVKGREYYVRAFLYDHKYNNIQITSNIHIHFEYDNEILEIIAQKNHELLIKPKKFITKGLLKAKLHKIANDLSYMPKNKIETEQQLAVYSQVRIVRPGQFIHLPYLGGQSQIFQVKTLGGSGSYEYKIKNYTVGQIDADGVMIGKEIGVSVLQVHDIKNERNADEIEVRVTAVHRLRFPDFYKEIMVNSKQELFVIAEGMETTESNESQQQYSNCSEISFALSLFNEEKLIEGTEVKRGVSNDISKNLRNSQFFKESLEKWKREFNSNDYKEYVENGEISEQKLEMLWSEYQTYGICGELLLHSFGTAGQVNAGVRARNIPTGASSEQVIVKIYKPFDTISPQIESREFPSGIEIILSYGSSFVWQLEGGPQHWEDKREMRIQRQVSPIEGHAQEQVQLIVDEQETPRFHQLDKQFYIACPNPAPELKLLNTEQQFLFKLTMQNTADIFLHSTLQLSTSIRVSCKIPKVLQITPLTLTSVPLDVNTAKVVTQQTLHLSNTEPHYFQVYAYDGKNQPFFNFSSLLIEWEIRQDTRLALPNQKPLLDALKLSKLTQEEFSSFPFHAQFKLLNYLDQLTKLNFLQEISNISPLAFLIHASTTTYEPIYNQLRFLESWDQLPITAINPVSLTPTRQSLFFHSENQALVQVHHGSGKFEFFLNDSSVATFKYFEHNSSIVLYPFKLGTVKLVANDKLVHSSKSPYAIIDISYATGIQLHASLRIFEEGKYCEVIIVLLDKRGRKIPENQYQFIQFELIAKGVENDQRYFLFERASNEKFIVWGFVPGEYLIYAVTPDLGAKESEWLKSNTVEIIVFEKLYSNPSEVVIAPECITNVRLLGGPTEKQKHMFQIETHALENNNNNKQSYEIQQLKTEELIYRIKAIKQNELNQIFVLVHSETKTVLAEYQLRLKIGFVTEIEIFNMKNRNIYQGATFRLLSLFWVKNEQLTASICPFDISWRSYQESMLSVQVPDFKSAFERTKLLFSEEIPPVQYLLGTNASALGVGTCELELKVAFNYQNNNQYSLSSLSTINILEPHQTQNTLFINKENRLTSYLILPKNSQFSLNPNRPINLERFNMECSNNLATVSESGVISTYNSEGRVSINLEDPSIRNDYATVDLLVTEIDSILVESSYKVISIPIGSESNLQIYALDSFGRAFPGGIKGLQYQVFIQDSLVIAGKITHFPNCENFNINQECINTNNNECSQQQRPLLTLRGLSPGLSIIRVSLENDNSQKQLFDQFTVIVGSIITPVSPIRVHLGGEVQFIAQVQKQLSSEENQELWFSGDEKIVSINSRTGRMVAKREGITSVEYKDIVKYLSKVKVVAVDEILIDNLRIQNKVMTNIQQSKHYSDEYRIPFKLIAKNQEINQLQQDSSLPNINNNLRFECWTNADDWLIASSEIESNSFKQTPYCIIKAKKNIPTINQNYKIPSQLIIYVQVESANLEVQYKFKQEFAWERFLWGFAVEKNFIQLDKQNPKSQLRVLTKTNDLEIICLNEKIKAKLAPQFNSKSNLLLLTIDLSSQSTDLKTRIQLRNVQTNQTEIIHIHYSQEGILESDDQYYQKGSFIDTLLNLLLFIILIILCITLYRYWESKRQANSSQTHPHYLKFDGPPNLARFSSGSNHKKQF